MKSLFYVIRSKGKTSISKRILENILRSVGAGTSGSRLAMGQNITKRRRRVSLDKTSRGRYSRCVARQRSCQTKTWEMVVDIGRPMKGTDPSQEKGRSTPGQTGEGGRPRTGPRPPYTVQSIHGTVSRQRTKRGDRFSPAPFG